MERFVARYRPLVTSILSGFDRLVFRGTLIPLIRERGMQAFLSKAGVRLLDFKSFVLSTDDVSQTFDCLSAFHRFFGSKSNGATWTKTVLGPPATVPKDKSFSACNKRTRRQRLLLAELVMNNYEQGFPGSSGVQ